MTLLKSWVESANSADTPFPLNNLPYGSFQTDEGPHCGVAIGDMILDVTQMEDDGLFQLPDILVLFSGEWNDFMAMGPEVWSDFRNFLTKALSESSKQSERLKSYLVPMKGAKLCMPFRVSEYTDFYAGRHHATNVGTMFRGPENALPPNWLHIPIGYNGRASSVVVSGTDIRRPWGQLKGPNDDMPHWGPCQKFDIELELGAIVGRASDRPISVDEADANIFGYVLLNDWSARDIQAWEYQPLGPFQAKATATTISPWIVTKAALEPFRCSTPPREVELLPHLRDTGPMLYDIDLCAMLNGHAICKTNYKEMYYSAAQQLAHHSTSGCPMNSGDLLGSGTISGPDRDSRGSLLELSWGGTDPFELPDGSTRSFIEDGDELTLQAAAKGDGYTIGFGDCKGTLLPALKDPFEGKNDE